MKEPIFNERHSFTHRKKEEDLCFPAVERFLARQMGRGKVETCRDKEHRHFLLYSIGVEAFDASQRCSEYCISINIPCMNNVTYKMLFS